MVDKGLILAVFMGTNSNDQSTLLSSPFEIELHNTQLSKSL
jgi:hypothetical protein